MFSKGLAAIIATLMISIVSSAARAEDLPEISDRLLPGFGTCAVDWRTLKKTLDSAKPYLKTDSEWRYQVKGTLLGLPVVGLATGVCSKAGNVDCGWGSYLAVYIDKPKGEARSILLKKHGVDFTIEKRDAEVEATMRPVLVENKEGKGSILFCDPGGL
jgi:hypothetical protein